MDKLPFMSGSPEHEPTLLTRAKVEGFSCAGYTQTQIANYLQIDDKTLRKHYRHELDCAKMDKTMALSDNLYMDALNGDKDDRQFWLKTQGRWSYAKPKEEVEHDAQMLTVLEKLTDKIK